MVSDKWFFNMVDSDATKGHQKVSLTMNQKLQVLKIWLNVIQVCYVYPIFTIAFFVIIVVFLSMDMCMNQGVSMTKRMDNETK